MSKKLVAFRFSEETIEKLEELASERTMSKTQILEMLVQNRITAELSGDSEITRT